MHLDCDVARNMNGDVDEAAWARARTAAETIAPLAAEIEAARRLPPAVVRALVEGGLFKLVVPRSLGGGGATAATLLACLETIAAADGSAGWCAMIATTSSLMSAYLDEPLAREVYGRDDAVTSGVFAPLGRARRTADGLRVSGRWPFGSGCEHAQWRMGGVIVLDGDRPELLPSGAPHVQSVLFAAAETEIIDTWSVSGLRGTGSHDVAVHDVWVPANRCFSLFTGVPRGDAPIHRLPFFGVLAGGVAAVALGIARAAIDALTGLAGKKQPVGAKRTIAHRELVQLDVARAEAKVRAARAMLFDAVAVAATAAPGGDLEARAGLRLAAWHATSEAAAAVDLMYNAAGATAIYAAHPLQRHFRDVHVATQHVMVSPQAATMVGRVLLGVDADVSQL
jgi:alkylation response protein AidB-like acyl-CoA dehydrogenase